MQRPKPNSTQPFEPFANRYRIPAATTHSAHVADYDSTPVELRRLERRRMQQRAEQGPRTEHLKLSEDLSVTILLDWGHSMLSPSGQEPVMPRTFRMHDSASKQANEERTAQEQPSCDRAVHLGSARAPLVYRSSARHLSPLALRYASVLTRMYLQTSLSFIPERDTPVGPAGHLS